MNLYTEQEVKEIALNFFLKAQRTTTISLMQNVQETFEESVKISLDALTEPSYVKVLKDMIDKDIKENFAALKNN